MRNAIIFNFPAMEKAVHGEPVRWLVFGIQASGFHVSMAGCKPL